MGASGSHALFSQTQGWERDSGWHHRDQAGRCVTPVGSESCQPAAEIQILRTVRDKTLVKAPLRGHTSPLLLPELTFDPAHSVYNDGRLAAMWASSPQELKGFQVTVQVCLTGRVSIIDHVLWRPLMCERWTCRLIKYSLSQRHGSRRANVFIGCKFKTKQVLSNEKPTITNLGMSFPEVR